MVPKFQKLQNDPCFGKKCGSTNQCQCCFIKQACEVQFRNKK